MDEVTKAPVITENPELDEGAVEALADIMLLSLIRAYPPSGNETEIDRLIAAKKAVFGIKPKGGPRSYYDIIAMQLMAKNYLDDRETPNIDSEYNLVFVSPTKGDQRSDTQLAKLAYEELIDSGLLLISTSDQAQLERTWQQKFAKNRQDWLKLAFGRDEMAMGAFEGLIDDLRPVLSKVGLRVADIPDAFNAFNRPI